MKKEKNRYFILVMAAVTNFCYGCGYIWTVFQTEAKSRFQLADAEANRPFSIFMALFVIRNILGGKLQQKFRSRTVVLAGNALMCLGFLLTALVPKEFPWILNITYGVLSGIGAGTAYNALVAVVQKWFPDRRGLVTGITICSSGSAGLIMSPICNQCIAVFGFSNAMLIVTLIYVVIGFGGGYFIDSPPEGYEKRYPQPSHVAVSSRQFMASEMVHTREYYLIAGAYMLAVPAYFLINPMMKSLGLARGLTESVAVAGVMAAAVLNVAGRLLAPWISDRTGRKPMLCALFLVSLLSVTGLIWVGSGLFLLLVCCVAFAYGGFCAVFPVITSDYFGSRNAGMNYGIVMIGTCISSLLCPSLTSIGTGFSFGVAAVCCIAGSALMILLKKPGQA
ncbi:MAG: MFS transporter [Lachnospiraceae bacterium]|nr:MFS transporter [Lachnospiraceae bacterium]